MEMISPYINFLHEEFKSVNSPGRKIKSFKAQIISKNFIYNAYNSIKNNQEIQLIKRQDRQKKQKENRNKPTRNQDTRII